VNKDVRYMVVNRYSSRSD